MSGHATVDTAVEATRIGAVDFLEKPITLQKLLKTVSTALARPTVKAVAQAAPRVDAPAGAATSVLTTPVVAPEPAVTLEPHALQLSNISLDQPLRDARDEFERIYFEYHLVRENHSMTRVSERTGLERTHLYRKLKQLGIDASKRRQESR